MSNPDAVPWSSNGHVAGARSASINVCGWHLKEFLEELLITYFGSPNGVHNNDALCFTTDRCRSPEGSSLMGLVNRGSNVVLTEQVTVSNYTMTCPAGEVSTITTIGISFTMSVALSEEDPHLVFANQRLGGILLQLSSWTECGFPVSQS